MEDNFDQSYFEKFLQDKVRNQKMYPKDAVWRSINQRLHGDTKWPELTFAAVLLIGVTILVCAHFSPKPNIFSFKPNLEPLHSAVSSGAGSVAKSSLNTFYNSKVFSPEQVSDNKARSLPVSIADIAKSVNRTGADNSNRNEAAPLLAAQSGDEVSENNQAASNTVSTKNSEGSGIAEEASNQHLREVDLTAVAIEKTPAAVNVSLAEVKPLPALTTTIDKVKEIQTAENIDKEIKRKKVHGDRLSILFYGAPSISYRKLREDQALVRTEGEGPLEINNVSDVNDAVRHKPALGLEAGVSFLYNLTDKFRLKSGFQYNVRQYTIDAFQSSTEVTSITLFEHDRRDTLNSIAYLRNFNGYNTTQLVNRYHQLSVPIGLEWQIAGNKRIQLNVAGSIQPTYLINRNAYLLSTNFKNYTENEDMVRRWNINSNIEAFVSFVVGDFKWQLGPQIRYQPYSTFIKQYSIKEHLVDYGIKLGVSTSLH